MHAPSAFGYIEPLIEPLKQPDAVVLFHLPNAAGNGRLGHVEVFRRTGDVHRSADLQKDAHMADGHGAFLQSYQIGYRYNKIIAFYTFECKEYDRKEREKGNVWDLNPHPTRNLGYLDFPVRFAAVLIFYALLSQSNSESGKSKNLRTLGRGLGTTSPSCSPIRRNCLWNWKK